MKFITLRVRPDSTCHGDDSENRPIEAGPPLK